MIYLLHIDTSGEIATVSIGRDGVLLDSSSITDPKTQAGNINIVINEVLANCYLQLSQLAAVVVCAGPGSYTGLRIGLATAKGLCYALNKPLILHNKLELLANDLVRERYIDNAIYASLLKAREKEYFFAAYDVEMNILYEPKHIFENEFFDYLNNHSNIFIKAGIENDVIPKESQKFIRIDHNMNINLYNWAVYARNTFECNGFVNLSNVEPFYLKQVYTT